MIDEIGFNVEPFERSDSNLLYRLNCPLNSINVSPLLSSLIDFSIFECIATSDEQLHKLAEEAKTCKPELLKKVEDRLNELFKLFLQHQLAQFQKNKEELALYFTKKANTFAWENGLRQYNKKYVDNYNKIGIFDMKDKLITHYDK